jgi:plasmid stability protein
MVLNLDLSPDLEDRLTQRAAATGRSVDDVAIEALRDALSADAAINPERDHEAWRARLQAIIDRHPAVDHFVDDSRDSIYEGRGE